MSVFISVPKKGNAKEFSNYHTVALISHISTVMPKIFLARLQQYGNQEFPNVKSGFRKGRGTRDQVANNCGILETQGNSIKPSKAASLTMLKPMTMWITTNCGKFLKKWEYQTTLPVS